MNTLFKKEESIIKEGKQRLESQFFSTPEQAEAYRSLLSEYEKLLKDTIKIVGMADKMEMTLKTTSEKLDFLSYHDALTRVYNRRYLNETLPKEWKNAIREKKTIGFVILDVDHFKAYNDTYGHGQGDDCLISIAGVIQDTARRPRDLVARFGGDEFVMLLPESSEESTQHLLQKILDHVRSLKLEHAQSPFKQVTVSIGATIMLPDQGMHSELLMRYADQALYEAKEKGRNQYAVVIPSL